jgi:uncharacterized protein YcfJ
MAGNWRLEERTMFARSSFVVLVTLCIAGMAQAQDKTLAGTMGVFVFPADGQDATEQSRDEADCYRWATDRTGSDPFELTRNAERQAANAERAAAQAQQAGRGAAAGGAISGAAGGALVGAVFGTSRKNRERLAAAGALAGAAAGSAQRQQAQAQAGAAANRAANAAASTEAQMQSSKTAFVTCTEANDYVARF